MAIATAPTPRVGSAPSGRFRLKVSGLMLAVLVAAMMSAAWGQIAGLRSSNLPRATLIILEIEASAASCLLLVLTINLARREERWPNAWCWRWRLMAIGLLGVMLHQGASVVRAEVQRYTPGRGYWNSLPSALTLDARLDVLPVLSALILVGLLLGISVRRVRPVRRASAVGASASVISAVLVGLVIATLSGWLPYLVGIAIEHVIESLRRPAAPRTLPPVPLSVPLRVSRAAPEAALALLAGLVAAAMIARELRRGHDAPDGKLVRRLALPIVSTVATSFGAVWLVVCTIPAIQPFFMSGIRLVIDPWCVVAGSLSFAAFSAGLVAHAISPPEPTPRPAAPWIWRKLGQAVVILVALGLIAVSVVIVGQSHFGLAPNLLPEGWEWFFHTADDLINRGWESAAWAERMAVEARRTLVEPETWFPALTVLWLVGRVPGIVRTANPISLPSFDQLFTMRPGTMRFLVLWPALTALCLAACPILAVAGVILFHTLLAPLSGWPPNPPGR